MLHTKSYNYYYFIILVGVILLLLFVANTLSISYKESLEYFNNESFISHIVHLSTSIFGHNNIAFRLPFILFYAISCTLMYIITKDYFKTQMDRLSSTLLFMMLPGLISASLLAHNTIIVICALLLYLNYYKVYKSHNYILLFIFLFIDNSFVIFYFALFLYAMRKKKSTLLVISLILIYLSIHMYGFNFGGKPRGHLADTFTSYLSIFSPIIFLYYVYAMYRIGLKGKKTLYWYISITALVISFLLSMRQKINIEDFAPYIIITLPIAVKYFLHTLRVRIPKFRYKHYNLLYFAIFLLLINVTVILFSKPLYLLTHKPSEHFLYKYHFASQIAKELKYYNIDNISTDYKLASRLKFYGIKSGDAYFITLDEQENFDLKLSLKIFNKKMLYVYIVKINH